jgi:hypothetical protein
MLLLCKLALSSVTRRLAFASLSGSSSVGPCDLHRTRLFSDDEIIALNISLRFDELFRLATRLPVTSFTS